MKFIKENLYLTTCEILVRGSSTQWKPRSSNTVWFDRNKTREKEKQWISQCGKFLSHLPHFSSALWRKAEFCTLTLTEIWSQIRPARAENPTRTLTVALNLARTTQHRCHPRIITKSIQALGSLTTFWEADKTSTMIRQQNLGKSSIRCVPCQQSCRFYHRWLFDNQESFNLIVLFSIG